MMIDLTGPLGGVVAAAYGAGAVMGWGFASKTLGKQISQLRSDMKDDKADCDRQLADLTNRLRQIEDRSFNSMERQASQLRSSAIHVIKDGRIDPPLGGS